MEKKKFVTRLFKGVVFGICLVCASSSISLANRTPEVFRHEMGGFFYSCSIYREQAAFGKLKPRTTLRDVKAILGEPSRISNKGATTYHYPGFTIQFMSLGNNGPVAISIETTKQDDSFCTPDKVRPGMPESVLSNVYGTADEIFVEKRMTPKLSAEQLKNSRQRSKTVYTYNAGGALHMNFTVENGIIKKISITDFED